MSEPAWLALARRSIGVKEVPGRETSPVIRRWLLALKAWWTDDETPWCGVAVAWWITAAHLTPPAAWYRARAWLDWGTELREPILGCVVVYERGAGGHVGLVVGVDAQDRLMTLGGNQRDRVSVAPFERRRVLGYRWPAGQPFYYEPLPIVGSAGQPASTDES